MFAKILPNICSIRQPQLLVDLGSMFGSTQDRVTIDLGSIRNPIRDGFGILDHFRSDCVLLLETSPKVNRIYVGVTKGLRSLKI